MKKLITLFTFITSIYNSQTISSFDNFTLSPNSFYQSTISTNFTSYNLEFSYDWDNSFNFWSGGFAYTNKKDSSTGTFNNLYGCKPLTGVSGSSYYATGQDKGVLKILSPNTILDGMYITNTTYAFKTIKNGNNFAKKFGGATGNDPDYFKITAKGFKNGVMKADSSVFYLADYRSSNNAQDFIVENWQWFNTSNLGVVDSVKFFMYSSDVGQFGINTPLFFSVDDVSATQSFVGLIKNNQNLKINVYPNPFLNLLKVTIDYNKELNAELHDMNGRVIKQLNFNSGVIIDTENISKGIYILTIKGEDFYTSQKIIKE